MLATKDFTDCTSMVRADSESHYDDVGGIISSRQLYPSNGIERRLCIRLRVDLTRRFFFAQQRCSLRRRSVSYGGQAGHVAPPSPRLLRTSSTLPPHASLKVKLFAAIPPI